MFKNKTKSLALENKNVIIASVSLMIVSMSLIFFLMDIQKEGLATVLTEVAHHEEAHGEGHSKDHGEEKAHKEEDSSATLSTVFEHVSDEECAFVLDNTAKFYDIDDKTLEKMDLNKDELFGKEVYPFIHKDDVSTLTIAFIKALQTGKTQTNVGPYRFSLNETPEKYKNFISTVKPILDKEGNVSHILVVNKDITATVTDTAEEDVEEENEEAPVSAQDKIRNTNEEKEKTSRIVAGSDKQG